MRRSLGIVGVGRGGRGEGVWWEGAIAGLGSGTGERKRGGESQSSCRVLSGEWA